MFDSIFRSGEKRKRVSVMIIVKEVRFQRNEYFIPRSVYCIYQEKDPSQRITSSSDLHTLADTRNIPINDTLKFHASLFESKNDNKLTDKKRRLILRQLSIIDEQEAYKDIGYFDLQLNSLVEGPRTVQLSFEIIDDRQLLQGQVIATVRYRFRDSDAAVSSGGSSSSSKNLIQLRKSSSVKSVDNFEEWSDDDNEEKEEGEQSEGQSNSGAPHTTMSRQISGSQFELPSLNRVNSVAPPRGAAPPPFNNSAPTDNGRPSGSILQRKVTSESISSIGFTSAGQMVDSRDLAAAPSSASASTNRYARMQPLLSNASMLSTGSDSGALNNNNNNGHQPSSSSPQVGISHSQLAERSTLSMESLHSSSHSTNSNTNYNTSSGEPQQYFIQLARSTSANSIRSLGTAKSNSVKSVRFDDDVIFSGIGGGAAGASVSSGGSKQRGSAAGVQEEVDFGVTFEDLEDCYQ